MRLGVLSTRAMRGIGEMEFVSQDLGVDPAIAQQACAKASGQWDAARGGCTLDTGASLPSWCSWVPFSASISDACKLPSTVADINAYGNYSVFKLGQRNPDAAQSLVEDLTAGSQTMIQQQDCAYTAAANHSALSQVLGPDLACSVTDPFNVTSKFPGWMLYAGLGVGALLLFKVLK